MAQTTDLTTEAGIAAYLQSKNRVYESLAPLSGGTANYVYLLTRAAASGDNEPEKSVLKHAEPFVKNAPALPFAAERMDFEARVLELFSSNGILREPLSSSGADGAKEGKEAVVKPAAVYSYDSTEHVLELSYGGPCTLKQAYPDPAFDVAAWGARLGRWLANLHSISADTDIGAGGNVAGRSMYRFGYKYLGRAIAKHGFDVAIGERIDAKYGSLLESDDEVVCHGDFWPGNVLVGEDDGESGQTLTIVDWEMCRRGCGATDVGQFLAEAWLLDRFSGPAKAPLEAYTAAAGYDADARFAEPGRGLAKAFLKAYVAAAGSRVDARFAERVVVHFGMHYAFWPTQVKWTTFEETGKMVAFALDAFREVERGNWAWFKGSVLEDLAEGQLQAGQAQD